MQQKYPVFMLLHNCVNELKSLLKLIKQSLKKMTKFTHTFTKNCWKIVANTEIDIWVLSNACASVHIHDWNGIFPFI